METKWTAFIIFCSIQYFILCPLLIYWSYKFYQHRNHIAIQKRTPYFTLIFCVNSILVRLIERPLYLFGLVYTDKPSTDILHGNQEEPTLILALYYLRTISFAFLQISTSWVLLSRFWMIYFNVNWTRSTMSKTWKIHINPVNSDKDWFLTHKSTYGNFKYNLKGICIIYLTSAFILVLFELFMYESIGTLITVLLLSSLVLGPVIGIFVLGCKIRKYEDNFMVIKEFNYMLVIMVSMIFVYIIVGGILPEILNMDQFWRGVAVASISSAYAVCFMYNQTMYVLKLVRHIFVEEVHAQGGDIVRMGSIGSKSESPMGTIDTSSLGVMLSKKESFNTLMLHLSKEWSMECLLSFVELTQWQYRMCREYESDASVLGTGQNMILISLQEKLLENKNLVKSYIVYPEAGDMTLEQMLKENDMPVQRDWDLNDKMIVMKLKAIVLYRKYVEDGDLQINISYEQQQKLITYMGSDGYFLYNTDMTPFEVFNIYSDVIVELTKLLNNSYSRFLANNANKLKNML